MSTLLLALAGFAFLDSLDLLLVGVTAAVVADSKLARRSPLPGGLSFVAGVFAMTTAFGILTVLGIGWLTELVDFRMTPAIRYRGELVAAAVLLALAALPAGSVREPPAWAVRARRRPWVLALVGMAIGLAQAPTAVPYLAGLAMLSARQPPGWPAIIVVYCVLALSLPLLVLALAARDTRRTRRAYRAVLRGMTRYGPASVRILFALFGIALLVDALIHHTHLW
ncbi:GAP family protein [Nocardia puris]|uniref:Sap-like sulfolipid-1-addressing protein n=1 Tax=Nocardia puris TaxID=208602 RepID=A0A366E2K4_9NOCA|nr:GAP family protein [Nocardia puris]MBF6212620.1 GAP family protein [Nocardia puris]MBF6369200.1 GAP family protein [Nocardia puris]MBF6461209.1 GAP family protein [Nocardia puris]RBO96563.1 Sap-like sulfolipid-1-addressing protein [Nocardia puris]